MRTGVYYDSIFEWYLQCCWSVSDWASLFLFIDIKYLTNSLRNSSSLVSVNPLLAVQLTTPADLRNDICSPTDINKRLLNLAQGIMQHKLTSTIVLESTVKALASWVEPICTPTVTRCTLCSLNTLAMLISTTFPTPRQFHYDDPLFISMPLLSPVWPTWGMDGSVPVLLLQPDFMVILSPFYNFCTAVYLLSLKSSPH